MEWSERARRLFNLDWTGRPQFYVLILVFLATRLPFVGLGFGGDTDAWLIALTSYDIRNLGVYAPSRFPGYPVPEFAYAAVIDGGWIATNTLTVLVSLAGVLVFARLLRNLGTRNKGLLVLSFAFFPALWSASVVTMDYMWALTFLIGAWFLVVADRPLPAGLIMGLAIGSRLTTGVLILPLSYLLWVRRHRMKDIGLFVVAGGAVALLAFAPLFLEYGTGFLRYYPGPTSLFKTGFNLVMVVGLIPAVFALAAFAVSWRRVLAEVRNRDRQVVFLLLAMAVVVVTFLCAPYAPEYLVPAIPFGLLLLNRVARTRYVAVFFALVLVTSAVAVTPTRDEGWNLHIHFEGILVQDTEGRIYRMEVAEAAVAAPVPVHSVVIFGLEFSVVRYLNLVSGLGGRVLVNRGGELVNVSGDVRYVYLLSLDQLEVALGQGYAMYYVPGAERDTQATYGYSLQAYNCTVLSL